MRMLWCWRCRAEIPMLDEEEFASVQALYTECMGSAKGFRQAAGVPLEGVPMEQLFEPVRRRYEELTGMKDATRTRSCIIGCQCMGRRAGLAGDRSGPQRPSFAGRAWRRLRGVLADWVRGSSGEGNSVASSCGLRDGLRQSGSARRARRMRPEPKGSDYLEASRGYRDASFPPVRCAYGWATRRFVVVQYYGWATRHGNMRHGTERVWHSNT